VDNTADVDLLRAQITAVWGVLTSAGT
jgi:hypothetical protein